MYRAMTARDLQEWEIDYAIGPWDEERADLRNGILCSLLDACHRAKGQPRAPIEYMPYTTRPARQNDTATMKANLAKFLKCDVKNLGKNHG